MRAWILAVAGVAALVSLPAVAGHRHSVYHPRPFVSFSYGYPFAYSYYRPYPYYYPYAFGPTFGVGVHVGQRYPVRRARTERTSGEQGALKMYVYPAAGQTEAQTAEDRYQCHVWAADQSDFDPTLGAGRREQAESYSRAFTACMEGRNYVVK
ncbi:MAG TPA: hypothetical protein VJA26_15250 [Gammaproteobacteria bacterium]|nr:hypothetical protein [Gammaproteobacteria bacterium]